MIFYVQICYRVRWSNIHMTCAVDSFAAVICEGDYMSFSFFFFFRKVPFYTKMVFHSSLIINELAPCYLRKINRKSDSETP